MAKKASKTPPVAQSGQGSGRKKWLVGILAAVVAAVLLISLLIPLLPRGGVVSVGDERITEGMYNYWLAYHKYRVLVDYKAAGAVDFPYFWNDAAAGYPWGDAEESRTNEEYFREQIDTLLQRRLAAAYLFDSSGFSLTESERNSVEGYLSDIVAAYYAEDYEGEVGTKDSFNAYAAQYGCTYTDVRNAAYMDAKADALYSRLAAGMPDSFYEDHYKESYGRFYILLLRTKNKYVKDEEGNYVTDTDAYGNSYYVTEELTEDERIRRENTYRLIVEELEGGNVTEARFKELLNTWSDDTTKDKEQYADGFYFCEYTNYVDKEIVSTAMELEVGDYAVVETEEYGYHVIFRCALKDAAWKDSDQAQWFESFAYDAYYETYLETLDAVLAEEPAEWDDAYADSLRLADIYCKDIFYDRD